MSKRFMDTKIRLALALLAVLTFGALGPAVAQPGRDDERHRQGRDGRHDDRRDGVTLYEHDNFGGRSETFYDDDPDLGTSALGKDRASSARVPRGCRAILFEHPGYAGRSAALDGDVSNLGRTPVGNDTVSSVRVRCGGWDRDEEDYGFDDEPREGAILYDRSGYTGRREAVTGADPDLRDNRIGNDDVDSVRVARGCKLTLYDEFGFRGRSVTLEGNSSDLDRTALGRNRASSYRVDCDRGYGDRGHGDGGHGHGHDVDDRWEGRGAAILYDDVSFGGDSEVYSEDDPNLSGNPIGNDHVSSVRVRPGCEVALYSDANYRGRYTLLRDDEPDLRRTAVGNDAVSSIRVRCR